MKAQGINQLKAGLFMMMCAWICADLIGVRTVAAAPAASRTYTLDADFDDGTLINVNHDIPDQLQLNTETEPLPFIWVAASGRGTIVRIHTKSGQILGEYRTAPETVVNPNPSRTTVEQLARCWVANRGDTAYCDGADRGSVTRVGLIIGGTRLDSNGNPDDYGEYLAPPYEYNTCDDRNGDGLIRTSWGLGSILGWPNTTGEDTCGGVETAHDECIINYTRVIGTGTRTVAIDKKNDVWVGGIGNRMHEKLDGVTGQPGPGTQFDGDYCGGYGGLVDPDDVLWSASSGSTRYLLRVDTTDIPSTLECIALERGSYGLALDENNMIWHTNWTWNTVMKIAPDGTILNTFGTGGGSGDRGVAVTSADNDVWVANSYSPCDVSRLDNNGNVLKVIDLGADGMTPTGVAVDPNGKVWVTCYGSDTVKRIDPTLGSDGLGEVDLTVNLGPGARPYNYSDMTGLVGLAAADTGYWVVTHDGGEQDAEWKKVTWNTEDCADPHEPPGTSLTVEVRAGNASPTGAFILVQNGVEFSGVTGQFIEIRVTFRGVSNPSTTPYLCDLSVHPVTDMIPTVSEWGLAVMALLLLAGGKTYFSRRRAGRMPA